MRSVPIPGGKLEVLDVGGGEPVVFIQTALTADELLPVAEEPALGDGYRRIVHHRRGYAGSSSVEGRGSIPQDAADCAALLAEMDIARAHEFLAANDQLIETRRESGLEVALDDFLGIVIGPDWRKVAEEELPGSVVQMHRDVATFFDNDLPALLDWQFGSDDASGIDCPVLYVGGTDSGPWWVEVRELMLDWFPRAEDVVIDGADHSLVITHPRQVAESLAGFLRRHPIE